MQAFARLYEALESTTSTNAKVAHMVDYFHQAPAADAAWAVYFLAGRRPRRLVAAARLREWLGAEANLPDWLVEESCAHVGDLAECIALLIGGDGDGQPTLSLHHWLEERILPLADLPEPRQRVLVTGWWRGLERRQCFLLNKLLSGGFRVGVSKTLVIRALAQHCALEPALMAHRLSGGWQPTAGFFQGLSAPPGEALNRSRPYPFHLAWPLDEPPESLGDPSQWLAEWKWNGIRAQLLHRDQQPHLWSRGEELLSERFPEILDVARALPTGLVLDGEILAWNDAGVQPLVALQQRINRKRLTKTLLAQVPAVFLAYDLLEVDHEDIRAQPLQTRRERLAALLAGASATLRLSPILEATDWGELAVFRGQSRQHRVDGLMLKRLASPYGVGRQRGDWWKWPAEPYTVDAVMIYAQAGRRANLYTDYTFAVWDGDQLVPLAKANSGLSDGEIQRLDRWIRQHTLERFGPVRSVAPTQVFELAFDGIDPSARHKSGVVLRMPRISRWREDKPAAEADTLETVRTLLG